MSSLASLLPDFGFLYLYRLVKNLLIQHVFEQSSCNSNTSSFRRLFKSLNLEKVLPNLGLKFSQRGQLIPVYSSLTHSITLTSASFTISVTQYYEVVNVALVMTGGYINGMSGLKLSACYSPSFCALKTLSILSAVSNFFFQGVYSKTFCEEKLLFNTLI